MFITEKNPSIPTKSKQQKKKTTNNIIYGFCLGKISIKNSKQVHKQHFTINVVDNKSMFVLKDLEKKRKFDTFSLTHTTQIKNNWEIVLKDDNSIKNDSRKWNDIYKRCKTTDKDCLRNKETSFLLLYMSVCVFGHNGLASFQKWIQRLLMLCIYWSYTIDISTRILDKGLKEIEDFFSTVNP